MNDKFRKDRDAAILWAKKAIDTDFLVLDTETTGLEDDDQAVQLGIVSSTGKAVLECLFNPAPKRLPEKATAIHGITLDDVEFGLPFIAIGTALSFIFKELPLIYAYNADFDRRILQQTIKAWGMNIEVPPFYDVMKPFARFYGEWNEHHGNYRWQKLEFAARHLGVEVVDAHSAAADARMTLGVMLSMASEESIFPDEEFVL